MHQQDASTVLTDGFAFTECPRWHEGRLWFVDMHLNRVVSVLPDGSGESTVEVPGSPGGIGWLPDGRLLIVLMAERQILRLDDNGLVVHADLSETVATTLNDLAVDTSGRCYVGETGFDPHEYLTTSADIERVSSGTFECPESSRVFLVDPDGEYREVTSGLSFANGIVIDEKSNLLFVAESFGARLSRYDLRPDGGLANRTELFLGFAPDGIAIDQWGCVWVADVFGRAAQRIDRNGALLERTNTEQLCLACTVGGVDGDRLYLCSSPSLDRAECLQRLGSKLESHIVRPPVQWNDIRPT
ncbi:SMP-30/gluconolactonase/LRE family protein [Rhodococcus sp. MSC1_016]|uniref:SMP-30/gluconolactonase/LRE family protein n=1 Tax=Rhodococcus sp. MSC1_016 TaxID=2909266 RepID=UPI00202E223D|nr:SMP-30/gluconolactonase/LRE family protein [Rhodococcus sp. MSC1_016]